MKDIDWEDSESVLGGYFRLLGEFNRDPLTSLFDRDARQRLVKHVMDRLAEEKPKTMWVAEHMTAYKIIPESLYGVFGQALASRVGLLVMKSLYPDKYAEETR